MDLRWNPYYGIFVGILTMQSSLESLLRKYTMDLRWNPYITMEIVWIFELQFPYYDTNVFFFVLHPNHLLLL
jgi:hypothetical protein